MPTTTTTPTHRNHRVRAPDWGSEKTSARRVARHQGQPGATPATRRASRAALVGPVADEIPRRPAPLEVPSGDVATKEPQATIQSQVRGRRSDFWSEFSAAQPLLVFSFLLGVVFIVLFGLDLCTGWLFWRASVLMDVSFTVCGLGLIFLCWDTYRDFR